MIRRNRGFTLIEMLVTLILLVTAGLLLPRLFRVTMRVVREAPEARDAIVRHDAAIDALRRDVWSAREIVVEDNGKSLRLSFSGQTPACLWRVSDDSAEMEIAR